MLINARFGLYIVSECLHLINNSRRVSKVIFEGLLQTKHGSCSQVFDEVLESHLCFRLLRRKIVLLRNVDTVRTSCDDDF